MGCRVWIGCSGNSSLLVVFIHSLGNYFMGFCPGSSLQDPRDEGQNILQFLQGVRDRYNQSAKGSPYGLAWGIGWGLGGFLGWVVRDS